MERHIKATALMTIRRIGEIKGEFTTKIAILPFYCDGVYDQLVYDTGQKRFIEIWYTKCVGEVTTVLNPAMTGYSDKTEKGIIKL